MAIALTESAVKAAIKRAATEEARVELSDADAPGLRLRVTAAGAATWALACRDRNGAMRRFELGKWPKMGIAEARRSAATMRVDVRRGSDPIADRRAARVRAEAEAVRIRLTLGVLVDDWSRKHLAKRSERYRTEAVRALNYAFAEHWERPAEDLDRATVRRVLDGIDRRRAKRGNVTDRSAIQARTVAYGRACFGWALEREMVQGNPFLSLPLPEAAPSRDRVLSDQELVDILDAAGVEDIFGRMVLLLAVTGQRREEVAGMEWSEISRDLATWTIPAIRAKNDKVQIVPLSVLARTAFVGLKRKTGLVFPSGTNKPFAGWAKAKQRVDKAIKASRTAEAAETRTKPEIIPPWRLHDLRRTLATGLQAMGVRLEVTEAVLNHASGSRAGIVGVYQRHEWQDEKREALDAWGARVVDLQKAVSSPGVGAGAGARANE
jgi:integrase